MAVTDLTGTTWVLTTDVIVSNRIYVRTSVGGGD